MMSIKNFVLTVSIAIVFALFVGYGVYLIFPSPDYSDYCDVSARIPKAVVENVDENIISENVAEKMIEPLVFNETEMEECTERFDNARKVSDSWSALILGLIGLISIIIGISISKFEGVGSGILGGGVLTIIYATGRFWEHMNEIVRFLFLGIVLYVLIWAGIKVGKREK